MPKRPEPEPDFEEVVAALLQVDPKGIIGKDRDKGQQGDDHDEGDRQAALERAGEEAAARVPP